MKTKTIFRIASAIIGSLTNNACNQPIDTSQIPMVNSVSAIKSQTAIAVPLTDEKLFVVTGRISHSIFLFGEGVIVVEDLNNPEEKLYLIAKGKRTKGEVITATIKKKEMLSLDDTAFSIYIEK